MGRFTGDREVAQAAELIRALHHQLREMTDKLAWVERQDVTRSNGRACALRLQRRHLATSGQSYPDLDCRK
jgi:hypothetical protein